MDKKKEEIAVAEVIERVMRDRLDADPGERHCHDGRPGRLDVDFVYNNARPRPMALEITTMVNSRQKEALTAANKHNFRLSRPGEGRPGTTIDESQHVKTLEREVPIGVVRSHVSPRGGCTDRLQEVAVDNASKLKTAKAALSLETHLAVKVAPMECSAESRESAVPRVDGIDWIWVVFHMGPRDRPDQWSRNLSIESSRDDPGVWSEADRQPWLWYAQVGDAVWTELFD